MWYRYAVQLAAGTMRSSLALASLDLVALLSAAPAHHVPRAARAPTVTIKNGSVAGSHDAAAKQDFFLGLPFAQPPTGANRYRLPQSINTTFDAVFAATQHAPECYGYGVRLSSLRLSMSRISDVLTARPG
jgi:hypothetical protein